MLHELLTGEQLFAGENDLDTLKRVKEMPLLPPSAWNPGVKPALDSVVMRALERDPAKRYRTAGQMGDELEALVLRKSYSTRALARKARELAEQEAPDKPAGTGARPAGAVETELTSRARRSSWTRGIAGRRRGPRPRPSPPTRSRGPGLERPGSGWR